jgi:hypothetical protein
MIVFRRCSLAAALGVFSVAAGPVPAVAAPADGAVASIEAVQGTVVRWSVPGTKTCGMGGRTWDALQETCYYPIDMLHEPGLVKVNRKGVGPAKVAQISVGASSYGTEDVELADIPQANPSPEDLRRNARDQALVEKIWTKREGPARFTLPLGSAGIAAAGTQRLWREMDLQRQARLVGNSQRRRLRPGAGEAGFVRRRRYGGGR